MRFLSSHPGKVLLFGEYTVILGGAALALPLPQYQGQWTTGNHGDKSTFTGLFQYLEKIQNGLKASFDDKAFSAFRHSTPHYSSNIPIGMGLGSSGALCAGLYRLFFQFEHLGLDDLKGDLALLESYYHGKSSGLDALVCLLNKGIVQMDEQLTSLEPHSINGLKIYLLMTGKSRKTEPLVQWFRDQLKDNAFHKATSILLESNQRLTIRYLQNDFLVEDLQNISRIQWEYMQPLIIPELKTPWKSSLDTDAHIFKLCGAGGGGCYLVFSGEDLTDTFIGGFPLIPLFLP